MTSDTAKPACVDCDGELSCPSCTDPRPIAGRVDAGWRLLTPLGRWEDVVSADQPTMFDPVLIRTRQSGEHLWRYRRTDKVHAHAPHHAVYGTPEVRIIEGRWRDGPIQAVACTDREDVDIPTGARILAFAAKEHGTKLWIVYTYHNDGNTQRMPADSKATARTLVRAAGRAAAKTLGVRFRIMPPNS